jgi:O-antigen ligase
MTAGTLVGSDACPAREPVGTRLQTIERPNSPSRPPRRPPWAPVAAALGGVLAIPLLLLAIFTRWGVVIVVLVALTVGLAIWVWQRGFHFIEIVAFLIHFDGLGVGPIRMGRVVAGVAACLLIYKLVAERWRPPAIPTRHWVPVFMLIVWAVFSGAWSDKAGGWLFTFGVFGLGITFFCIAALMVDSHQKIQQFLRAYWVGGLFGSGAGILALFLGTRSVGFGGDPNFFGLLQASMIPLTVYYRRHAATALQRHLYTIALLVVLAGAAGAGSRSGLIGGTLAIIGTMVTRPGIEAPRRVGVAVSSLFVGGLAFLIGFVANPANVQRGFSDRGAGRLDLWTVSIDLIREQPIVGYGLGQLRTLIAPFLLVTPGSQKLSDSRTEVSAHNTWLDIAGDLGAVGVTLFVTIIVVALVGFIRPRWLQAKELSATLFVMMLPVLSGSMFLPLLNNKLAWALIGLSAALQVPSWGARWTGLPGTPHHPALASGSNGSQRGAQLPVKPGGSGDARDGQVDGDQWTSGGEERWEAVRLARWDLRVSRRSRTIVVIGAVVGAIVMGIVGGTLSTNYTATAGIMTPRLDGPESATAVSIDRTRMQGVLTLVISTAYARELKELSGLDLDVTAIRDRMMVTRPGPEMGAYIEIQYADTSRENTLAVMPHLVTALDRVFENSRDLSEEQVADEIRPLIPGEQRYFTGDYYWRAYRDAVFAENPPRAAWLVFVGFLTGGLLAAGFVLAQQRFPRVTNDDDYPAVTGLAVWTHVGPQGGRAAATPDQFAQVLTAARDHYPGDGEPRRFVISSPRPDRAVRGLAMGVAAQLAAEGRRVLLVDAQLDRPLLSLRVGGFRRAGLADIGSGRATLDDVIRRVPRWRLPAAARRVRARGPGEMRFISAGRLTRTPDVLVPLEPFDQLDPEVHIVLLAPPALGDVANAPVLGWGDAVVMGLVEGRSITFDAEDAASRVRAFAAGPGGIVLLDI